MTKNRKAQAQWKGTLKDGKGTLSTGSGALKQVPYTFAQRFEDAPGTNPEELIAAAHAGCFSMAFSGNLAKAGLNPENIETAATVKMEKQDAGWRVTASHLDVKAKVPGAQRGAVEEAANTAKGGCPISQLLKAEITLSLHVET